MSAKVVFEIGHIASLKSKITPEGFTHDWELYVRGCDAADISHYIDKVVFNLHESFPRPKRVFKEPPYSLKESGYAGFVLPIDIYFKNRDDPKKVTYNYDLNLQNTGTITNVEKKVQVFKSPSDDFRRKLIKGGGFMVNNFPNNSDEKAREQDERAQLISKPKLGGSELGGKKYKSKSDEAKVSNTYTNLFGPSGSKTATKVSPDAKKASTSSAGAKQPQKSEKTSRDKSDKEKKEKNKHNSPNKEKTDARDVSRKTHDDKHEKREEKKKDKSHSKERGRSKDKVSTAKPDPSPKRTTQSPKRASPSRIASALSKTDDAQSSVKSFSKQPEPNDRPSSSAKKPKKDKKEKNSDKERDRERAKDQKQKEERPSSKVSDKIDLKKEKESGNRNQKDKAKVSDVKQSNPTTDQVTEPVTITPNEKKSEKDPDRKHKHKKKDKNKDKEKEHTKERKKEKSSKYKEDVKLANTTPPKKSEQPQASQLPQQQTKVNPLTTLLNEIDEKASSDSDDDHSKPSISYSQPIPAKLIDNMPKPADDPQPTKSEKQLDKAEKPAKRAKKEKETKTSDKEDKKRKRKSKDETPSPAFSEPPLKQSKKEENGALPWRNDVGANFISASQNTPPPHRIDAISRSSPLPSAQKSTPSRSSSQRATPSPLSTNTAHHQLSPNLQQQRQQKDYMSQLKELQHKIMSLEDNNELQQVVEMIIETGNYEITGEKTFDFDLCALDRTTVQRLQTFFATSSCWL
ncbi:hypothetical protein HA402_007846 [Bradysia odoriphaga]|nr:hypothetical protein HA402_007846 [Bradysia odoriphaga]